MLNCALVGRGIEKCAKYDKNGITVKEYFTQNMIRLRLTFLRISIHLTADFLVSKFSLAFSLTALLEGWILEIFTDISYFFHHFPLPLPHTFSHQTRNNFISTVKWRKLLLLYADIQTFLSTFFISTTPIHCSFPFLPPYLISLIELEEKKLITRIRREVCERHHGSRAK